MCANVVGKGYPVDTKHCVMNVKGNLINKIRV